MDAQTTTIPDEFIPTRYSLLSRLQDWDDDASWRTFFDTYWRLIYSVALRAGLTPVEAEEVVQETVICVARNIQSFKRDRRLGSFKGWLRNITRWRIADQFKKRTALARGDTAAALPDYASLEGPPDPADNGGELDWDQQWQSHLLQMAKHQVKRRVSEEQYQLFDLYVVKEWPVARIREMLGVSATQIYLAKHRIARLLRKEVRRLEKDWDAR